MSRFIAFVGDPENLAGCHAPASRRTQQTTWSLAFDHDRLKVYVGARPNEVARTTLLDMQGVVIGSLFSKKSGANDRPRPEAALNMREVKRIVSTSGMSLIDCFWGSYVAFVQTDRETIVIRDPTGGVRCYYARWNNTLVFFSHLEDCVATKPMPLSIDWRHVGAYLQFDRVVTSTTGFQEVAQLRGGECAAVRGDVSRTYFCWSPERICKSDAIDDTKIAGRLLRATVLDCVTTWASCYSSVLHDLSGGLDSSIVLTCLAKADRTRVLSFNVYSDVPEGDERYFARLAAKHVDCELMERLLEPPDPTGLKLNVDDVATPTLATFVPENDAFRAALCDERGIQAIFSGQGGDHLFQQGVSSLIPAEYIGRHGMFHRQLWRLIVGTARTTGKPVSDIARSALRHAHGNAEYDPYVIFKPATFVRSDVRDLIDPAAIRHPWVDEATSLSRIKLQQIFSLVDCQILTSLDCKYAALVHPLISQPIIEACLRIPGYVLADGGRDRALYRKAFRSDLPEAIVTRTQKGGANSYFYNIIDNSLSLMRELLLDGDLVRAGLLDRASTERALTRKEILRPGQVIPILTAFRAEVWTQAAQHQRRQVAAA